METQRGRNGGVLLGRLAANIRIGDVVRLVVPTQPQPPNAQSRAPATPHA